MKKAIILLLGFSFTCMAQRHHTVVKGDTLSGIAKMHYGSGHAWKKLHKNNPKIKNPHRIYPGDIVHLYPRNNFYLAGGLNYYRNMASGQQNQITIDQVPPPAPPPYPVSYLYQNDSHADNVGLYLGGGYQWMLSSRWSWSLGGRLSYNDLEQKGSVNSSAGSIAYSYDIRALVLNSVFRLNWCVSLRNALYGEVTAGIANLKSKNFHLTNSSGGVEHVDNSVNRFDYGLAIGWLYRVATNTSLDVAVGYQDLGKAILGHRAVQPGATSQGEVKQKLRGINARIGLVHWF